MKHNIKIRLPKDTYRDSVYGCWIGKNIGGTIGTPYEGKREELDVKGFVTEAGAPLPNDDLDLQLAWLYLVEKEGSRAVNCRTLGEYWMNLIMPHWNEYGLGKNNMRRGIAPPMSGDYDNDWKDSNGAWIRTEIWACLAPACPDLAAKFALEDARVDHGAGEGTYAAIFVAAMQSAAFAVKDVRRCIEVGLAEIPAECRVADSVRTVLACYDEGKTARETRNVILARNADIGDGWFEAPSNVAYALIGLLWGEGDFKKSMIAAVNCGDDTDCTCATVGATMGILYGSAGIPDDWRAYIGDEIITISVNKADEWAGRRVPKTCTELTDRVCAQAPYTLFANHASTVIGDFEDETPEGAEELLLDKCNKLRIETVFKPFTAHYESDCLIADTVLDRAPEIAPEGEIGVVAYVRAHRSLGDDILNLKCRWWLPEGFSVEGRKTAILPNINPHEKGIVTLNFKLRAGENVDQINRCVLEIVAEGRFASLYIPVVLLG